MATFEVIGGPITHKYLMGKTKSEIADMYMRMLRETAQDAREAELYRQQLAPVPAQGAEGVEALAADDGPLGCAELFLRMGTLGVDDRDDGSLADGLKDAREAIRRLHNSPQPVAGQADTDILKLADYLRDAGHPEDGDAQLTLQALAERLRNSPESTSLLFLLSDIRAAAGDPTGRLMQDELVARVAWLRVNAERWETARMIICAEAISIEDGERADCGDLLSEQESVLADYEIDRIRNAIAEDAARSAGGDDEA